MSQRTVPWWSSTPAIIGGTILAVAILFPPWVHVVGPSHVRVAGGRSFVALPPVPMGDDGRPKYTAYSSTIDVARLGAEVAGVILATGVALALRSRLARPASAPSPAASLPPA